MARDFFPLGRLILAASQTNALDEAQAISLAFLILNFHVKLGCWGLDPRSFTSLSLRIITVLSLFFALFSLFTCSAVKHSAGFSNSPEPTMIRLAGAVML